MSALTTPADAAVTPAAPLLDELPAALLRLDRLGRVVVANAAARALLGEAARPGCDLRQALGLPPGSWPTEPVAAAGSAHWLRLQAQGDWLLVEDQSALVESRVALQRQGELLDLAQDFGRLGVWQRDLKTLEGRWDRHVAKFWGLEADAPALHFDAAMRQVVDADRATVDEVFKASLTRPGSHAWRYRVQRRDGGITHLHSQWTVKAGPDGLPERAIGILIDDSEAVALARSRSEVQSQLALVESLAGLIVWRYDLRTRRVHLNREGWALLGRPPQPEGITAAEARRSIHPHDRPALVAMLESVRTDQPQAELELRHAQPDGRWRHVLMRCALQRDDEGGPGALLGVGLDVTARSAEAQRARELNARLDLATRTAGIGYWAREGPDERAFWNEQMRELHGLPADAEVPTLREWIDRFVHVDERADVHSRFIAWLKGETPYTNAELRIVRTDGQVRHVRTVALQLHGGEQPALFGLAIDVTDRRLVDLALRRADERAALAARGAGIGTWELDRRDGTVHWDEQMWRLRGRLPRAEPPTNEELVSFVHPEDRPLAALHAAQAKATEATVEHQFRVVWPDGSVRWLASRSAALRDAQGTLVGRIGVNWDVTAQRDAESERSAREAAQQASAAKSRFLARMSHELRTPLNAVLGFTQLMQIDDDPAQRAVRLQHVCDAGQHLLSLIDDVLDLAGLDTGELRLQPETLDLAQQVAQALPLVEPMRAAQGLTIVQRGGGVTARADPLRLRQVLLNLLSNACKYNRPGGRVQVEVTADGEHALLAIADTGRGMDESQLRALYQPFNRLGVQGEDIEGSGIGLTIVKALVERMGGSITVHSQPAVGSRFELRLPNGGVPAPVGAAAWLDTGRGVLYVEDNPVNTLIVREMMQRRRDIPLRIAADGRSGLAEARRAPPALVLLDMQLPDMDGLAVLDALRADPRTAGLPVVAVSANALPEDVDRARAAGIAAYWTKPLDMHAFGEAIDALFGPAPVVTRE
jgi:PAS domain S-box-containing protein